MEDPSVKSAPQIEAKNLANDDDKPLITTEPVVTKCPDTMANCVSSTTAHVHTSVTRDHSIIEPCNECSNFNIIHKNESLEPTHNSSTSESTGISTDVSRWEETALNASNRKSDNDPGKLSELTDAEKIILNSLSAQTPCLSNCISSNTTAEINHSDDHNNQSSHEESENETQQYNSKVTEEVYNADARTKLDISKNLSESENETHQNNSNATKEIDIRDGRSNLHISNHISESENETQQNNSDVTEEINNKDGRSNLHINKHISDSENETQQNNSDVTGEINNKDGRSNLHISKHISESENETQQNNSNVTDEINVKDGGSNLHISNHFSESENETQQNNSTVTEEINNTDGRSNMDISDHFSDSENETQQSNLTVTEKNNNKDERNSYDMSNNFKEATAHLLDVIIEESGESSYASSESLVSGHTEEIPVTNIERSVVNNDDLPKTVNQGKVPVRQIVPNIETDNKFDKCYSLEEADSFSDSSSNSMLRKLETDSDVETVKSKSDSNARGTGETQSLTYQEETCSTDLLHHRESYCETSFGTCDMDGGLSRWNSKRKGSRHSRERKESLEQRLRRRFTIHDEHKQEVAKRIIALVIKYSLFVFNFCSWVVAAVAIGLGLWVLTDKGHIISDGSDFYLDPTIMIVIVGGITFVVAFLGCVGALRENLLLLKVFFIVLGVIVVIELIIAISIIIMYTVPEVRERFLRSTPEHILRSAIERYMDDSDIKTWIDLIQQEFRCCGVGGLTDNNEGFRDWQINAYFNCTPSNKSIYRCAVPTSCCIFEKGDRVNTMCGFEMSDKKVIDVRDYIYTRGCIHGFGEWLSKYDELIVIAALTTLIMQFLAVISAKIMIRRIVKRRQRWGRLLRSSTSTSS